MPSTQVLNDPTGRRQLPAEEEEDGTYHVEVTENYIYNTFDEAKIRYWKSRVNRWIKVDEVAPEAAQITKVKWEPVLDDDNIVQRLCDDDGNESEVFLGCFHGMTTDGAQM